MTKRTDLLNELRGLIARATRYSEECRSASVTKKSRDGAPVRVSGFDTRTMNYQLDIHSASGAVTESIRDLYGDSKATKAHEILAGVETPIGYSKGQVTPNPMPSGYIVTYRPTSSLSHAEYKEFIGYFVPAYLNVLNVDDVLQELSLIESQLDDTGRNRVERAQEEALCESTPGSEDLDGNSLHEDGWTQGSRTYIRRSSKSQAMSQINQGMPYEGTINELLPKGTAARKLLDAYVKEFLSKRKGSF